MPIPVSDAMAEAYASAPAGERILCTVELRHPAFVDGEGNPAAIRAVLDNQDFWGTLEATAPMNPSTSVKFEALDFDVTLPPQDERPGSLMLKLDNVPAEVIDQVRAATTMRADALITYREWFADDPSEPILVIDGLRAKEVSLDDQQVTAEFTYDELLNRAWPRVLYTPEDYPGLF